MSLGKFGFFLSLIFGAAAAYTPISDCCAGQIKVLITPKDGEVADVFVKGVGHIDSNRLKIPRVFSSKTYIFIDNNPYPGAVIIDKENGKPIAINSLDVEDYLKGVLINEASHYWPMEALKAQAVVARTYAYYKINTAKNNKYDVLDSDLSQIYTGRNGFRYRTNLAIAATKGQVLYYNDEILPTFYHSNCGGHTESAALMWGDELERFVPLNGVECNFCAKAPNSVWEVFLTFNQIEKALAKAGLIQKGFAIRSVEVVGRTPSGRVETLILSNGTQKTAISGKDFRQAIGYGKLRSTMFDISPEADGILIKGHGWGHGVGLCQWGAYFMAKEGYDYKAILEHYFPGAILVDADAVLAVE